MIIQVESDRTYCVARKHPDQPTEIIAEGLTLNEAESYCSADATLTIWATEAAVEA